MHVLFLTDNFPPEVNAPASRTFEHCREWVRAGRQVTVITCAPNFPKGRVFPGYRNRLWQSEAMDGVRVIRVWTYISANNGFFRRILDYLSFMVAAFLASLFVRRVDVIVGTSPQFFTVCAAWVAAACKRVPWVFELRDLWPESIKAVGAMRDSPGIRLLERLELFLYRKADRIVTVTHAFRNALIKRGVDGAKIAVVTNGVDLSRFFPAPKDASLVQSLGLDGRFVVGYIGTHGMAHALETLLDAAAMLQKAPHAKNVMFLFLGDGARKAALVQRAGEQGLKNVLFLDSVVKDEVARYWSLLDVSVIHLRNTELFSTVIPSKLFECMGMGVPVLLGLAGEAAEIVLREEVGEVFDAEDAEQLVAGVLRLRDDVARFQALRANALRAAPSYERTNLALKMLQVIESLESQDEIAKESDAGVRHPSGSHQDGAALPRLDALPRRIPDAGVRDSAAPANARPSSSGL
jgi:glycosyltransferase involved in cell wall biosynthesis